MNTNGQCPRQFPQSNTRRSPSTKYSTILATSPLTLLRPDGYAIHQKSKRLAILEFTIAMDSSEDLEDKRDAENRARFACMRPRVRACACVCVCMSVSLSECMCVHDVHVHLRTNAGKYSHAQASAHTHMHTDPQTFARNHRRTHTQAHARTHARAHTHTAS